MSAGVFPPTSSRSTRPRTSTRAPEFAGYSGLREAVSQRIGPGISATAAGSAGSHRWFPGGPGVVPPEPAEPRMGGLTVRGANGAFACPGNLALPEPALSPKPTSCLLPQAHPWCACSSVVPAPLPGLPHAPRVARAPAENKAFACGVPGALRGTWVSPTRFDEDERPVSRERLYMRGMHSHEASSWARGYYAE